MRPKTALCPTSYLRQIRSVKFFFLVGCVGLSFSFIWIQAFTRQYNPSVTENLIDEALENIGRDYRYADVYRKTTSLPKNLKYLLLWTRRDYAPLDYLGTGQRAFLEKNCSVINCYVTADRNFFGNDITKFDAIIFNGRNLNPYDLPTRRSPHQKYIFMNMESADNYPVCNSVFDRFFNWTSTYRLDSDIPYPYLLIRDSVGKIVGPKRKMNWTDDMKEVDDAIINRMVNKTRAAAWFVSHCTSRSHRKRFVRRLQGALAKYRLNVDIYGTCGTLKCPRNKKSDCDMLLERDYYFYMSLENSFAEDYVTEKLLTALQHDVVPIVYGGADYTRFLPPGSYIDGRRYDPEQLAAIMNELIHSPKTYVSFFRWKHHYTYHDPSSEENVCSICKAMNEKERLERVSIYQEFRQWWEPDYRVLC